MSSFENDLRFGIIKEDGSMDMVFSANDTSCKNLVKLSSRSLTNEDSKAVSRLLHAIGDFERIADHAVNILNVAKEKKEKSLTFSSVAQSELEIMIKALNEVLDITIDAFEKNSTEGVGW